MKLYIHASEMLTGEGIRQKDGRRPTEDDLGRVLDGALVVDGKGAIVWTGETRKLPREYRKIKSRDLEKKSILIPGLVDAHTHTIFAGDRADEFARRCAGESYESIRREGGGIQKTVRATRSASAKSLFESAVFRVEQMIDLGVRTIEVKSGYGLSTSSELKLLAVAQKLKRHRFRVPIEIVVTTLGAHDVPPDMSKEDYLAELIDHQLPLIAKKGLADHCDIFVDKGYYTLEDAQRLLGKAKQLGFRIKIHADELVHTGSADLAAQMGALSADHLLKISDRGIESLASSQTVAVLLPGTALYLKAPYAPARKMIDAGVRVAVATDFNPGSCMCLSLPVMMSLSALYMQMSRSEIFAAVTYNAARALGLAHRKGTLTVGHKADVAVLPVERFEELYYRLAWTGRST